MRRAADSLLSPVLRSAVAWAVTVGLVLAILLAPAGAAWAAAPADLVRAAPADEETCSRPDQPPLPAPGTPGATGFWARYREPLPPAEVYNPPGPKRVGLQAGHWLTEQVPPELRGLGPGASGGGKSEWEVNLDIAQRTADYLRAAGIEVDILPTTLPIDYKANVFLSIHADGDEAGVRSGYKLGRAVWSATPDADDALIAAIDTAYGPATGLPVDPVGASRRMTAYYAFNSRRYCHAVAPGTPSAIIEAGYLTSSLDRQVLIGDPDSSARGIATGIQRFLDR